ncbi:hypothetical protein SASPL_144294 [Salvia splendens]|uniref:3'-5' exonuclease domain-containing protein n=1 Tax=Salvia splendens TaxID=180675 RepID=A0A8X8WEZ6_SALSN|nr:uncharacterized protein LOC121774132 [Salvia splendens]KAG6393727.1 hypothetical protein SASPL_144294 [Salvia splendens]
MAAGDVYLRTNRFEVKLEGITFKKKVFESLCEIDFLFPEGKTWDQPPVVGLDVMPHPRDPSIILLFLNFGVGCVILRFSAGESLPAPIHRFLADKRIRFVGFGITEKIELLPFNKLGLKRAKIDIGHIAARVYKDPKYKRYDLGDLARKVVGIKRMTGLTDSASFDRHAQIKRVICQLFVTSLVATRMFDKKRIINKEKKTTSSFLKNLNSLQLLAEGWLKLPGRKKRQTGDEDDIEIRARMEDLLGSKRREDPFPDYLAEVNDFDLPSGDDSPIFKFDGDSPRSSSGGDNEKSGNSSDDEDDESSSSSGGGTKKPIKGILKCPSTTLNRSGSCRSPGVLTPLSPSPAPSPLSEKLRRANSKGCNVKFNM